MKISLTSTEKKSDGVYILHNAETGVAYIGSGKLGHRYASHHYLLKNGRHFNSRLQKAFDDNPNFEFIGIPIDEGRDVSLSVEQELITEYASPNLLNVVTNLSQPRLDIPHTEESKEKMRTATTLKWQDPAFREKTVAAQAAGRAAMTEEERNARAEKIGTTLKSQYDSGERTSTKGQVRSEEFCRQNSSNVKSLWDDPEWRANMLEARKGKTVAPKKAIVADGVTYESMSAAALAFGISVASVAYRLDSPKFNWNRTDGTCC